MMLFGRWNVFAHDNSGKMKHGVEFYVSPWSPLRMLLYGKFAPRIPLAGASNRLGSAHC